MSCEDNGIKFEVISAYVEGNEAKIFISVQDIDGDRIDETTDLFDNFSINTPFDCSSSCENISYDTETKTATFLISISQWNEKDIIGEKITFCVRRFRCITPYNYYPKYKNQYSSTFHNFIFFIAVSYRAKLLN